MSKSYVTMEEHRCPVCGIDWETGAILLDQRMRERFEKHTVTGWGMCPEHQKVLDEGYVIMVEAKDPPGKTRIQLEDAERTGRLCYVRKEVANDLFNVEIKELAFVEPAVLDMLEKMQGEVH